MPSIEIQDAILSPLLPNPVVINENGIEGLLFIDGNIGGNCILFRFLFDQPDKIVPVFLEVRIAGKQYRYLLSGRDLCNPMVKSPVLFPEANIAEGIELLSVRPLVSKINKHVLY